MKSFALGFTLVILFTCHQSAQATSEEEGEAMILKVTEECIKDVKLSPEEVKLIMDDKLDDMDPKDVSKNLRCFVACFYKKMDIVDANGKPNEDNVFEFASGLYEDKKDKIKPAMAKCANIKDADPCEQVFKYEVCLMKNIEA